MDTIKKYVKIEGDEISPVYPLPKDLKDENVKKDILIIILEVLKFKKQINDQKIHGLIDFLVNIIDKQFHEIVEEAKAKAKAVTAAVAPAEAVAPVEAVAPAEAPVAAPVVAPAGATASADETATAETVLPLQSIQTNNKEYDEDDEDDEDYDEDYDREMTEEEYNKLVKEFNQAIAQIKDLADAIKGLNPKAEAEASGGAIISKKKYFIKYTNNQ